MGCFLFSWLFWGAVVILIGLSIILTGVLDVKIPLFRIVVALVLIYLGVSLLIGRRWWVWRARTAVFSDSQISAAEAKGDYSVVFGRSDIDFRGVALKPGANRVEVSVVFGSSIIRVDPAMPVRVKASSAFGSAQMPDGNSTAFGEYTYKSPAFNADSGYLDVRASVGFGGLEVVTQEQRKKE